MLAGRYPSDEFAELRPRLVWDRVTGTLTGRPGAQRLAVTSGGTIPDRGLFGVFLAGASRPVAGSASSTRRWSTSRGSATCSCSARPPGGSRTSPTTGCWSRPRPGQPGRLPFWKGDALGPAGRARPGARRVRSASSAALDAGRRRERGCARPGSTSWAADNLLAYLAEQREATGHAARRPHHRRRAVPRRARRLAAGRALAVRRAGARAVGAGDRGAGCASATASTCRSMHADDGIVLRLPDTDATSRPAAEPRRCSTPTRSRQLVTAEVGGSALFASRFRECAARALLLPRRDPRPAHPAVAAAAAGRPAARRWPASYGVVPDRAGDDARVPAGRLRRARAGRADARPRGRARSGWSRSRRRSRRRSPGRCCSATSAQFLYEGDAPLAERRAAALSLDPTLLAELLGQAELRELLDADVARRGRGASCSGCPRTGGPATPRTSPTCCACSAP